MNPICTPPAHEKQAVAMFVQDVFKRPRSRYMRLVHISEIRANQFDIDMEDI